ncbi:MAG: hypothetical protein KDA98_11020 [Acidimicrobiales bacterium]|nr:hypothetical protein [Acidimicrobiales bacterium]
MGNDEHDVGYDEHEKEKIAGAAKESLGEFFEADDLAEIGEEEQREAQEAEEAESSDDR